MRLLFLFFLALFSLPAAAQPYGFLTWSVEDGLPQSQVTALAEDARGFLWVGTNGGGVARFDGADFEVFGIQDGLEDNFIRAIITDPEREQLLVLTRRGLAALHRDSTHFTGQRIQGDHSLFTPGNTGVLESMAASIEPASGALTFDFAGERIILTPGTETWRAQTMQLPQTSEGPSVQMRNGMTLLGTRKNGLILRSASGEPLQQYTEGNGDLPHNTILALLADRQGRYWIGTSGGGLVRMIPTGLRYFDMGDGLLGKRVYALHAAQNGQLWIGTRRGIQVREGQRISEPPIDDPARGVKITSITEDAAGRIYYATDGRGIVMLDTNRVSRLTLRSGLASDFILKLLSAADSSVWAITYASGVNKIDYFPTQDSFAVASYPGAEVLAETSLASAILAPDGSLLLGTTKGQVQRWRPGQTGDAEIWGADRGLPPGRVVDMALRLETQLWVAVSGYGVYYTDLRNPGFRFFPVPNRMKNISTNIFQLAVDPIGPAIWLGTERGITRLHLNADGQPDYARNYGRAEGFLGGETTRGAVTVDSLQRIWFGTLNGLVRYEEDRTDIYLAPPQTVLERVNLFYNPVTAADYELSDGIPRFAAANNHFQFRFRAVDLTYPDRLRYRFRLRGESGQWSPLTDERAVRYAGLPSGRYTFVVEATTDGGATFGKPAEYTFVIATPLGRSGWFLGIVALLAALAIVGVSYAFYRRVQKKEAALRAELSTQKRLLELEQKARQLQMNPHFIFNALNGIRGLVNGENDAEARTQITRFATLMRGILSNSRQEMISLAEEVKVLKAYIEMEQFCQNFPITYTLNLPADLDPEEVNLPPMLLQPFVENAVLHGLAGRDAGGHIDVNFVLRGRRMQCSVEDNGIGRQAAAKRKAARTAGHQSVAVDVTRERLHASGGQLEIRDRPGGGTIVEILVPVELWG